MRSVLLLAFAASACAQGEPAHKAPARPAPAASRDARAAASPASSGAPAPRVDAAPGVTAPASELDFRAVDALIEAAIAAGKLPGCVVAIGRSDRVLGLRAYGKRALVPEAVPMTEDTLFDLASLTKAVVTASLVMKLVDEGKLALDERVRRRLTEISPKARNVTVASLLTHVSGLPQVDPLHRYDGGPERALQAALGAVPTHAVGSVFEYSDVGYIWLGELLRRASGEPLEALAQRALFAPLGMRDTGYRPDPALLPRIAPTEITELRGPAPVLIHGVVHDPRAYRLGGVAGNAGVFSTASDLARFARMLLGEGQLDGVRVLSRERVAELSRPRSAGGAIRTLGWDVDSRYSRLRGKTLSARAFGHGGHTGTALFVDPGRNLFVVFLSHRVHPDGKGDVIGLVSAVTDALVEAAERALPCARLPERVLPGIDVLRERGFADIAGKRIALVTHLPARARDGTPTLDVLRAAEGVELVSVLTPEHGLAASREGVIASGRDAARALPLHSLFGPTRRPTEAMLHGADAFVVDLVDVGTRFYTYMSTLHEVLRAGAELGREVIVLDRPNPLGGERVDGPVLDGGLRSFVNHHALPVVHGLTAGELARLLVADDGLKVNLTIVEASHWRREQLFDDTGLRWYAPSPNLPRSESALLYPAVGLLESTNVSVGRGTSRPFEQLGAPWIDARGLLAALRARSLPGLSLRAVQFTPKSGPHAGAPCHGVALRVTDARAFDPVRTGLALAGALIALHGAAFESADLYKLLGSRELVDGLLRSETLDQLTARFEPELSAFRERRSQVLTYPSCGQQPVAPFRAFASADPTP